MRKEAAVETLWTYRARPVRCIDGDTLTLDLDLGFGARIEADLRIAGIDAPEIAAAGGEAALAFLRDELLGDAFAAGRAAWPLRVRTRKTGSGREARSFARYVGDVRTEAGTDVAEAMVATGMAVAIDA